MSVDDVAKRLIDYGFHAPTMSFPVAGTLMIEPTESEDLAELDRFCDAMIAIRAEIRRVEEGEWPRRGQPAAPRTPHRRRRRGRRLGPRLSARRGRVPRRRACAPTSTGRPSSRIDDAYGDRNVMCACPPVTDYAEESSVRRPRSPRAPPSAPGTPGAPRRAACPAAPLRRPRSVRRARHPRSR